MKFICLTRGQFAKVDDEDFESLNQWNWYAAWQPHRRCFVAKRTVSIAGKRQDIFMHRQIMSCPRDMEIDHKNGNTLDNQKSNLQICTSKENSRRSCKRKVVNGKPAKNQFKGVYSRPECGKWRAAIRVDGKKHHLGLFVCQIEPAKAYDKAARKYFGKFAYCNFEN